jgi:DNA-binding NarL/FixJ family response regulator
MTAALQAPPSHHATQSTRRSQGEPRAGSVSLAVYAADPLTFAGATSELGGRPEIRLVADADTADVLLVIGGVMTLQHVADLCARIEQSRVRLVLVTSRLPESGVLSLVRAGLVAVVPQGQATVSRTVSAVLAAHRGEGDLPGGLLGGLLDRVARLHREVLEPHGLTASGVSERERDVLRLIADGLDTAEIAERLAYAERTVKKILHGLVTRLRLRNRSHAVAYALREGVI